MNKYYVNTWLAGAGKLIVSVLVNNQAEGLFAKAKAEAKYPFPQYQTFICPVRINTGKKGFEQLELI